MRLAILDDYQGVALKFADWRSVPGVTVVPFRDHVHDEDELVDRLVDFDAIMRIRERTPLTRAILTRLPRLKLILATGMRNAGSLDLKAAEERGIVIATTSALHQTTVEVTWAMILSLFRLMPQEAASLRAGGWQLGLGRGLAGRTLGIVGLGNMGIPVARIGRNFGMRVIAWSRNLTPERTAVHEVECVAKGDLFSRADAITIHMPLVPETRGLVGAADLALMKPDAFLINTSRAEIVDQAALIAALTDCRLGGAGIDVFDVEPLPLGHPFRTLPNVIATPHIGFVTEENYRIFFEQSLANLKAFLGGQPTGTISAREPFRPDSQVAQQRGGGG